MLTKCYGRVRANPSSPNPAGRTVAKPEDQLGGQTSEQTAQGVGPAFGRPVGRMPFFMPHRLWILAELPWLGPKVEIPPESLQVCLPYDTYNPKMRTKPTEKEKTHTIG